MRARGALAGLKEESHVEHLDDRPVRRRTVPVGAASDRAEIDAERLAERALSLAAAFHDTTGGGDTGAPGAVSAHRLADSRLAGELELDAGALDRASGNPRRLDESTRQRMESGFGRGLTGVRIHTGDRAASLAADMGARAFTVGKDVYFGAGQYQPGSTDGDHVLAHELAHTVQAGSQVHRFPADWNKQPVMWSQQTSGVRRPGGGISGGVYILTSKDGFGPVKSAVVKPTFGKNAANTEESGAQIVGADRLMREFGLNAPTSRVVKRGTPEFDDLVALCAPKTPAQPAAGQPGHDNWQPLTAAEDIVVMSEIVNAKTFSEMAVDAGRSSEHRLDLVSAINNPDVMHDLGLLMVADMVTGNSDRFVGEVKNLGNVMVSVLQGRTSLTAFDTTAVLPRLGVANQLLGTAMVSNTISLRFATANPGVFLEETLGALVEVVKKNEPPLPDGQDGPTFGERLDDAITKCMPKLLGWYMTGWNAGLAKAMELSQGDRARTALGDVADETNLDSETLKATLTYVGNSGDPTGKAKAAALALPRIVAAIDLRPITPDGGFVDPSMWTKVPSDAVKAEWVDNQALPTIAELNAIAPSPAAFDASKYRTVKSQLQQAYGAVATALPDKVRRGKSQPRNRAVLGRAVVSAEAIAAGSFRLAGSTSALSGLARKLSGTGAVAAHLTKPDAAAIANKVATIEAMIDSTERTRAQYDAALVDAQRVIGKSSFPDRVGLVASLGTAHTRSQQVAGTLQKIRGQKLEDVVAAMRARATS